MSIRLDPNQNNPLLNTESKTQTPSGEQTSTQEQPAGKHADKVELTPHATNLKQLERTIAELPEVDQQRVEQLRQALRNSSYNIDVESTVDKMLALETSAGIIKGE